MAIDPRSSYQGRAPRADLRVNGVNPVNRVVTSAPQSDYGGVGIPDFLAQLVEPALERKQRELIYKGFTEQAAKRAEGGVLDDEGSPISNIFGPSYYQEGAAMYEAQTRIQEQQAGWLGEMDTLKLMKPDELAKKLADDGDKLMTGNPWADKIIQQGLMNTMGPMIDQVTRARVAHQQQEAVDKQVNAIDLAATNLQTLGSNVSLYSTGDDGATQAYAAAEKSFLGLMAKPPGQTDESFRKSINTSLRMALDKGNLHAFELLKSTGILGAMEAKDAEAIERMYDSKARAAMNEAAVNTPGVMQRLLSIEILTQKNKDGKFSAGSADKAMTLLKEANEGVKAVTGSKTDMFTLEDFVRVGGNVVAAQFEAQRREQAKWESRMEQDERDRLKAQGYADSAKLAAATGGLGEAVKIGATTADVADLYIRNQIRAGNLGQAYLNFKTDKFVSQQAVKEIAAGLENSLGKGYTNDVDSKLKLFNSMVDQGSIGMAQAYYGTEMSARMAQMSRAIDGGATPQQAYEAVMADKYMGTRLQLDPAIRKEAGVLLDREVKDSMPGWASGLQAWPESTKRTVKQVITEDFAIGYKNYGRDPKSIAAGAYEAAVASGRLEVLGGFAIVSPSKREPLAAALKVPAKTLDRAMFELADERFKAAGYGKGAANGEYSVIRAPNNNVVIIGHDPDKGTEKVITMRPDELKRRAEEVARKSISHGIGLTLPRISIERTQASKTDPGFAIVTH
ncbi:internal virion protein [Caulobacter phage Percy]|uniref:Internal virion protein n=1 Tax=Caulobacter phage Percy TaxID=1701809 RepID=A0A0M4R456_9CAUD|nr:internal virion protein [Caulobacter phage Percy]ALF01677.1 internal virion protein [Caulobacter phage Percy]